MLQALLFIWVQLVSALPSTIYGTRSGAGSNDMVVQYDCGVLFPSSATYNQLAFSSRNGTSASVLVPSTSPGTPAAIAIDSTNKYMYIGQTWNSGAIERYSLTGTNKLVISATATLPTGATWKANVLRLAGGYLYWAAEGSPATINRLLLSDLITSQKLWNSTSSSTVVLDLDQMNNLIYFMTSSQLWKMNYDGSNQVLVANVTTGFTFGAAMVVVPNHRKIYYAGSTFGYMQRINVDGTGMESLSSNEAPWYTAGGGAFHPWYPDSIVAMRYDSTEDLIYFLSTSSSGDYLIAAPANASDANAFKSGMVVKLDLQYTSTTDFELGWLVSSQETACRVPCDQPTSKCNAPYGMCIHDLTNVAQTQCICQENPPTTVPTSYWGPKCSFVTNPCLTSAMTWENQPLCPNPRWNITCTTDPSTQSVSFRCDCPVKGESSVYQNSILAAICTCPSNNPQYVNLLGTPACGSCSGLACLCSATSVAAVLNPIMNSCGCVNATDCQAAVCASSATLTQNCRSALQQGKYCLPTFVNATSDQLTLAYSVLACDKNWFSNGNTNSGTNGTGVGGNNTVANSAISGIGFAIFLCVIVW